MGIVAGFAMRRTVKEISESTRNGTRTRTSGSFDGVQAFDPFCVE